MRTVLVWTSFLWRLSTMELVTPHSSKVLPWLSKRAIKWPATQPSPPQMRNIGFATAIALSYGGAPDGA
jgi:hypothetical protein